MATNQNIPPALAAISQGRDHLVTSEFALATGRKAQTVRKNYCQTGHCLGLVPLKIGGLLLWPVSGIAALLMGGAR
ncbi:hypothetical protein [Actimicrobium antarcticum]|uniref:Uncharacterized protein n=1 Tax=Actimicrobium antarcticum TaxID=1051899 RepID=A0ABP7TVN8_9BURK